MTPLVRAANFGPLVTNVDVDKLVVDKLRLWIPTYLAQLEREREKAPKYFNRPRDASYASVLDDDEFPDKILPGIFVTSSVAASTDPFEDGFYGATWTVAISAVVRGRSSEETRWIAAMFEGSIRRVMLQQPVGEKVEWDTTLVQPVADPTNAGRYLAAGMSSYFVYFDHVAQEGVGPHIPDGPYEEPDPEGDPDTPYDDLVTVGSVTTEVDADAIGQEGS